MTDLSGHEHTLFQRVAEGDEVAFTELFNLFLPKLYPFVSKFTKSESAAQEVIQETFIRVWMNRDKLEDIRQPGGWLFKVASNECYNYVRKRASYGRLFSSPLSDANATDSTLAWMDTRDLANLVKEAVDLLPAQRQRIYLMSRQEGKSIPEIAEALQLSPNTVKNALVTALQSIREYLSRHGIIFLALDLFLFY